MVFPAWLAITVTEPTPVVVSMLSATVAGPEVTAYVTGNPLVAVAFKVRGPAPYVWVGIAGKLIV
jgi:hypothetical protein